MPRPSGPSIVEFADFGSFLKALLASRPGKLTLRSASKALGLRSPATLSLVASGRRPPSKELVRRLGAWAGWDDQETLYADAMLARAKAKTPAEARRWAQAMRRHGGRSADAAAARQVDAVELVETWWHAAILEMTRLRGFRAEPAWIAARLGGRITTAQAAESLALLTRLGLLGGGDEYVAAPHGIPSRAVRSYHRQMLRLAQAALVEQDLKERLFYSQTVAIDAAQLPHAFQYLSEMLDAFAAKFAAREADEVYHGAVQLFRVTSRKEGGR